MSVDEFAKQFRWGTDQKTIKALGKMRTRELKEKATKIAQDAINKIKEREDATDKHNNTAKVESANS